MKRLIVTLLLFISILSAKEGGNSFFNPANLVDVNKISLDLSMHGSTEPKIYSGEGAFIVPVGLYQSGAIRVKKHRKNDGFSGFSSSLLYAISPTNRLSIGGAIGYLNYEDTILHHRGLLDVGVSYRVANHPILGQHQVGLTANNLFFASSGLQEQFETPTNIHASWDGLFWDRRIEMSGRVGMNMEDSSLLYMASVQIGPEPIIAALKAEINDENWRVSLSKKFMSSIALALSVSYGKYHDGEDFVGAFVSKGIGYHREKVYTRKMAHCCSTKPGDLWTKMLKAYFAREFYRSLTEGGKLVTEFPDFFQNSLAYYYLGNIFQGLDLRETSQKALLYSESKYPLSKAVPYCRLAQLKIEVRGQGEYAPSLYETLQDSLVRDSIRGVSHYYMGEYYLHQKQYSKAITYYRKVPSSVASYENAQRECLVAQYLKENSSEQFVIPESLVVKLDKGRSEYEKQGLEYYDLIKVHSTSYTIDRMSVLEELMQPYYSLIIEYRQLIENEKNRIYQLSQQ